MDWAQRSVSTPVVVSLTTALCLGTAPRDQWDPIAIIRAGTATDARKSRRTRAADEFEGSKLHRDGLTFSHVCHHTEADERWDMQMPSTVQDDASVRAGLAAESEVFRAPEGGVC